MSPDTYNREISEFDLKTFTELGAESSHITYATTTRPSPPPPPPPPRDPDEAEQAKWEEEQVRWKAEQKEEEERWEAEEAKRREERELRRVQAEDKFKAALNDRLTKEFQAGAAFAVSREASRAVSVRSYVLLGVVAAVVAMPLIAMFFKLDPQAFGAYIAPVTGITGTIVGYWFGTVGQGTTGQSTSGQAITPTSQGRSSQTDTK